MMFPSSLAVILTGILLGGLSLAAFGWAWLRGQFSNLDAQSTVILDTRDYLLERPWETGVQRAEREAAYGPLVKPATGEWGGAE
jgi:cbb3-type cytochrome oxidase maturation protein